MYTYEYIANMNEVVIYKDGSVIDVIKAVFSADEAKEAFDKYVYDQTNNEIVLERGSGVCR